MSVLDQCTLLYVEDEPVLRNEMAVFLGLHCARVVPAANGRIALDAAGDEEIDLVLTDIRMPEIDGLELTTHLADVRPELPVVLYTAFTDVRTLVRGIELGVAGFVQKPTDAAKLIATLERAYLPVLQRRRIAELGRQLQDATSSMAPAPRTVPRQPPESATGIELQPPETLPLTMTDIEKWALQRALGAAGGRKMVAARLLGMNYYTFRRHLARHGLEAEDES
jgi:DNA-binding NtrC family response regulator